MARVIPSLTTALAALVGSAATSGLLIANASAEVAVRRGEDDEDETAAPLLIVPARFIGGYLAHRSHRSHSSHRSHRSSSGHSYGSYGSYGASESSQTYEVPEPPPAPAVVSFTAFPGGKIYINDKFVGLDTTTAIALTPGKHFIRIQNRFLGSHEMSVDVRTGQRGTVTLDWLCERYRHDIRIQ